MAEESHPLLSLEEVRHIAALARLRPGEDALEQYRRELSAILEHVGRLMQLNVEGVEPMAHPLDLTNRLDEDQVEPALPIEAVLAMAPAVEDRFLAVPKVLE